MEIFAEKKEPEGCTKDGMRRHFFELLQDLRLPRFGGARGTTEAAKFLKRLEATYVEYKFCPSEGLMMAECHLYGDAEKWWNKAQEYAEERYGGNLWEIFQRAFAGEYLTQRSELLEEEADASRKKPGKRVKEISGLVKVEGHSAYALFDTGSTHSHVDEGYARRKGLKLSEFRKKEEIMYADGSRFFASKVCRECKLEVGGVCTRAKLTVSKVEPLDVMIGMDWLSANYAHIDCRKGEIEFRVPGKPIFKFQGDQGGK